MEAIRLKVYSPQGLLYDKDITQLETTTPQGRIGLNANQPKMVAYLKPNITLITIDQEKYEYVIVDGLLILDLKTVTIFTDDFMLRSNVNLESLSLQVNKLKQLIISLKDETKIATIKQLLTKYEAKLSLLID